jgi:hypothetical protein
MNFRKITNTLLAGGLALTMVAGVSAQSVDGGEADVSVITNNNGVLTVEIADASFGSHEYSLLDQDADPADIVVTVTDSRGSDTGWNVTLNGSPFSSLTTSTPFDASNLVLGQSTVASYDNGNYPTDGISGYPAAVADAPSVATIISAAPGNGTGKFDVTFADSTLNIPGGTLVGDYMSTLTVTLTEVGP